jgi:hypothetical protein
MENHKFEKEIKNLSRTINELHNTLHNLLSISNLPKRGELRFIRSKLKDSRVLLESIQKDLLLKDDEYQEESKILKQRYQEKKISDKENGEETTQN